MSRLVTLFTGQWADLPAEEMARKAKEFGYDGLEMVPPAGQLQPVVSKVFCFFT